MIKHKLPVYFNPEFGGLHVIHETKQNTVVVGGCASYYNDAYTNILRFEIPKYVVKSWKRINKRKLAQYPEINLNRGNIGVGINEEIKDKTYLFYKTPEIISQWYEK